MLTWLARGAGADVAFTFGSLRSGVLLIRNNKNPDGETEIPAPPPPTPEGGAAEVHIPAGPSQVFMRTLVRSDTLRTEEVCLATALTMNPYFSPGTGMKFLRKPMLLELGFKVSVPLQVRPSPNHSVVAPCQAPPR